MNNKITLETYDATVQEYINKTPPKSNFMLAWMRKIVSMLPKCATLLEIGSGTGDDAQFFIDYKLRVTASDASTGFLRHMHDKQISAIKLNILEPVMLDKQFDCIFANAVFLHFTLEEITVATKNVVNLLHIKGLFCVTFKLGTGEEVTTRKLGKERFFKYWSEEDLVDFFTKYLTIISSEITYRTLEDGREEGFCVLILKK
jgi:SAM-dependent methyltransferase